MKNTASGGILKINTAQHKAKYCMYLSEDPQCCILNLAHAWFLEIAFVCEVCMCMCVCLVPKGYKQILSFSLAIDIVDGRGLSNEACHELLPEKTKVMLYLLLISK